MDRSIEVSFESVTIKMDGSAVTQACPCRVGGLERSGRLSNHIEQRHQKEGRQRGQLLDIHRGGRLRAVFHEHLMNRADKGPNDWDCF